MFAMVLTANAREDRPPTNMIEYARWARETNDLATRIERLEGFMRGYLPSEDGGTNPEMKGYGDGSHVLAVAGCAWELARAYVKAGQKDKALKMIDWLQQHDSKSMLYPGKSKSEQVVPSDGHKPTSRVPSDGPTAPADAH
jgi:GH15 family glucan-1,4-alpha-glucosidase